MTLLLTVLTVVGGLLPLVALAVVVRRAHAASRHLAGEMNALRPPSGPAPVGTKAYMVTERELQLAVRRQQLLAAREVLGDLRGPTALVILGAVLSTVASAWSLYL